MKRKFILLLLITIVSFFSVSSEVLAAANGADWSKVAGGGYNKKGGVPGLFSKYALQGYRVTVFKKNGKNSKPKRALRNDGNDVYSIDYIMYTSLNGNGNLELKYTTAINRSKVDYLFYASTRNSIFNSTITLQDLIDRSDTKKGTNLGNGKRFPWLWGTAYDADRKANPGLNLKDWFMAPISSSPKKFKDSSLNLSKTDFEKIVTSGGFSMTDDFSTYYVVMEPMLLITYNSVAYFGTAYEIAYKIMPSGNYSTTKGSGLWNLGSVIRTTLPQAIYLSTTQEKDTVNYFVGDKSDGSNSLWRITKDENKKYTKEEIMGNNGLGIGAFWLGSLTPPKKYCDYNNPNHFKTRSSGPNGEDCCAYFSESSRASQYPNLVEDYEICGSCPNTTIQTTIYDNNSNDKSIGIPAADGKNTDTSDRCSLNGRSIKSVDKKNSGYIINDYLKNGIENNTCVTMTSTVNNNASKKIIEKNVNNYCTIKCLENDNFFIPSNPKVTVNTYHFVWPTSPGTAQLFGNAYPLNSRGTTTCRIIVKAARLKAEKTVAQQANILNQCATNLANYTNSINTFDPTITLIHTDTKNKKTTYDLESYNKITNCKTGSPNNINTSTNCSDISKVISNKVNSKTDTDSKVKELRNFRFSIIKSMSFKLPAEENLYVEKETSNSTTQKDPKKQYKTVGYGNIPVDFMSSKSSLTYINNQKVEGDLKITISDVSKHFENLSSVSCAVKYTAYYDDTYTIPDETEKCYCGAGTKNAGKEICSICTTLSDECVVNACNPPGSSGHFCSEWTLNPGKSISDTEWNKQYAIYGNDNKTQNYFDNNECSASCPANAPRNPGKNINSCITNHMQNDDDYESALAKCKESECGVEVCSDASGNPGFDITECVNNLKSAGKADAKAVCESLHCPIDECGQYGCCPVGTANAGKDISQCVAKLSKTTDEMTAYNKCIVLEKCDDGGNTPIVVYRPIDLNNPFPSIKGITNVNKLGRLPGLNWRTGDNTVNTTQVKVNKYITNNRNVTTNEVYNKKPLYTFELNAKVIADIKAYNSGKAYDDFTLKCTRDSGKECISKDFVHKAKYGFVSSASACTATTHDQFYACLN